MPEKTTWACYTTTGQRREHGNDNGPGTVRWRITLGKATENPSDVSIPLAGGRVVERAGLAHALFVCYEMGHDGSNNQISEVVYS